MKLRTKTFHSILRQDISYFDDTRHEVGKLCTRLATDAPNVKAAVGYRVSSVLAAAVSMIVGVVVAFVFGWKLALAILAMVPILIAGGYFEFRLHNNGQKRDAMQVEAAGQTAAESIENIRTVQAFGLEERFYERFCNQLLQPYRQSLKQAHIYGLSFAFSQSVIFFMYAAAFRFGAYLVGIGDMSAVDVYRVFFAISFCGVSIGQASSFLPDYTKARYSARLIFGMIRRVPAIDSYSLGGLRPTQHSGGISFNDVEFYYPCRPTVRVLRKLSFQVQPSQTIALVGPSGCGKSTVVCLLERFYDAARGQIMLDDYDLRTLNPAWLRSQIGIVGQEPVLFNCSIRENIMYGGESTVKHSEVVAAAKKANIHDFILTLPQGYNTRVGERGAQLSGGQKQRIAIARALIRNPRILLLDEATSALDSESEKVVQAALDQAREGRTCIVIAHRLSTVQNADLIVVMRSGKAVEQGTHTELLAKRGIYYQLVRRQQTPGALEED